MKKVLMVLLLLPALCFSQEHVNSFVVQKSKLLWENVFFTSNPGGVAELISKHPKLTITSSANNRHLGKATEVTCVCEGTSDYLNQKISFDFQVEVSENKYTVTVSNITFYKDTAAPLTPAEKYMLQNGNIKGGKVNRDLDCLDIYFNKIFTIASFYKNKS